MNSKSLLIAIAALALTATGTQAFSGEVLTRANLTTAQREAFTEARNLQRKGDQEAARNTLLEAGIDETVLEKIRRTVGAGKHDRMENVKKAVEANDYDAFKQAIIGTPLMDIITDEADFARFKEAHDLRMGGNISESRSIMDELGVPAPDSKKHHTFGGGRGKALDQLTEVQKSAFLVAKQANDRETMHAILMDAGVVNNEFNHDMKRMRNGKFFGQDE